MPYLLDTNILLRTIIIEDPNYHITIEAITFLKRDQQRLFIAPQNLIEFWNVATRPIERNGLGLSPVEAQAEVSRLKELLILLPDQKQIYPEWERLVQTYEVKGTKVHDTRLVAFMLVHQISHILTFNVKDFRRFNSEITPVSPKEIVNNAIT